MEIRSVNFLVELFGVLITLLAVTYAYFKWSYLYWKWKNVPYLKPKIPYGNLNNPFTRKISDSEWLVKTYTEAKAKGLKYCGLYTMAKPGLLILDLELLKTILTREFRHFSNRGIYVNEKDDPLSGHLFNIGGTKWRKLRTKISPTFTSRKLKSMFQTLADVGGILEKHILENINANDAVDIKDVLERFTTDVIGRCAFGIDCNSFKEPNSPFRMYGRRVFVQTKFEILRQAFSRSFMSLARALRLRVVNDDVSKFFRKVVEDTVAFREKNNVIRKDFMQLLIDLKHGDEGDGFGGQLTMDELAAQCFVFFLAGFETSSTSMGFALFELSIHQDIQDKVREEINTVLKKHSELTYDTLSELKYMRQVIDETLRKYPPGSFITRECVKDYKVDENLVIEKGVVIFIPIRGIHYDEEYYENPDEFDPDRFSEANKKTRHPYSHIPFGEGPRVCLGERFGIMQTKIGLISVLRNFKVTLHERTKLPLKLNPHSFVIKTDEAIWLSLSEV